jgi:regulator of replication initiation timing
MSTRVVDRVDEWRERPFSDGYRSLHELADEGFSGAVRAGGAELYMTKGAVVGIHHGDIDDFDGSGTAYEAPSPALPLLAVMQEANDEVRAEYYSEKTAIAEVDSTLSDGGFTGYVELADNVLSGDYYQVYHAGQSMSVGFIGESSRLVDGDEAFETANDEVGIYQVRPADIDVIELPEVDEPEDDSTDASVPGETDETIEEDDAKEAGEDDSQTTSTDEREADDHKPDETVEEDEADEEPESDSGESDDPLGGDESAETPQPSATQDNTATRTAGQQAATAASRTSATQSAAQTAETKQRGTDQQSEQSRSRQRSRSTNEQPNLALETRAIPSLDPKKTAEPDENGNSARADTFEHTADAEQGRSQGSTEPVETNTTPEQTAPEPVQSKTEPETQSQPDRDPSATENEKSAGDDQATEPTQTVDPDRIDELESEIADRDDEIERLESELDRKTTEYEDAKSQLETVREERDELATEAEELRQELEQLETELGAATDAERRITPAEALAGTDIFPRYKSKGDATLEKAHGGSHRREDVLDNLRLEQNTQFDADTVAVGGQEYGEFLEATLEYRFVNWVVGNLLFEVRETGHEKALKDLYDALPVIDWADLKGTVDVVYKEDGQETRSEESFDIVLRNRMGEPLLVANVNDSREGATQSMMENLVRAAERVGQTSDAFAGAFLVTRSFFEPPALETADDATKSGLLSRSKRKSFVNLSRKRGYHLCLVEARNENFTMLVPEL